MTNFAWLSNHTEWTKLCYVMCFAAFPHSCSRSGFDEVAQRLASLTRFCGYMASMALGDELENHQRVEDPGDEPADDDSSGSDNEPPCPEGTCPTCTQEFGSQDKERHFKISKAFGYLILVSCSWSSAFSELGNASKNHVISSVWSGM